MNFFSTFKPFNPDFHNDPFGRIIACQSMVGKFPMISCDKNVNAYFA